MDSSKENYKAFIDGLLGWPRMSATAWWVRDWDALESRKAEPKPANHPLYHLVPGLTTEQRQALCEVLQAERDAGIHETLTYLEPYTLAKDGVPLAAEPFATEMAYDFIARRDGDEWPSKPVGESDTMP